MQYAFLTRDQAKRFLLSKQGLLGRHRFVGKDGAYQVVRQAGCIQYDPVDVCGKNAELTLQPRVRGSNKQMLSELLYKDRLLVDYCDKELAIWPREDWPRFAGYRQRSIAHGQSFDGLPALEERAVAYIREHGPVGLLWDRRSDAWLASMRVRSSTCRPERRQASPVHDPERPVTGYGGFARPF